MELFDYTFAIRQGSSRNIMHVQAQDLEEAQWQADSMLGHGAVLQDTIAVKPLTSVPSVPVERDLASSHY